MNSRRAGSLARPRGAGTSALLRLRLGMRRDKRRFANRFVGNGIVRELFLGVGKGCFLFGFGGFWGIIGLRRGDIEDFFEKGLTEGCGLSIITTELLATNLLATVLLGKVGSG